MTHEQKPESAEFRTREAQADWMAKCITASGDHPGLSGFIREHLIQAEARGAAEQRRKDAEGEGAEPEAWKYESLNEHCAGPRGLLKDKWEPEADIERPSDNPEYVRNIQPLYTRPANVTALEARVKELEGALSYLEDEALRFADMYPQSSDMRNSFGVFASKIKAHAAAIREGG